MDPGQFKKVWEACRKLFYLFSWKLVLGVTSYDKKTKQLTTKKVTTTPQQYNKKPVKIGQGLDFLNFGEENGGKPEEKQRKKVGKSRKNQENPRISGPYFLIRNFLIPFLGCIFFQFCFLDVI